MVYGCARVGKSCLLLQSSGRARTLVETRGEASDTGREMGKRESDVEGGKERERERGIWNLTKKEREISMVGFGVVRERMMGCERWRVTVLTSLISN